MGKMCVGIYGISGSGKTTLCNYISTKMENFNFYDGSDFIERNVDGGINNFKNLSKEKKYYERLKVVREFKKLSSCNTENIITSGHFCFFNKSKIDVAWTHEDNNLYTHIFYLDTPPKIILKWHKNDIFRKRSFSCSEIEKWLKYEKHGIESVCLENNIKFNTISSVGLINRYNEILKKLNMEKI